ncbi:GNAT family N-acetyltransferase [Brachybacterium alimentarium]|uniref:GNAT family N-acetyltransferase n=1 Tax=Brachybacterium alimentarium TaxID=47845 RepID=UPI003FCFD7E6
MRRDGRPARGAGVGVRAGLADANPPPFDDPMSLYEPDLDLRVQTWLQGIWRGRGGVTSDFWRLDLVVLIDGRPSGMQDIIGTSFDAYGTAVTFSWLSAELRGRGLGREMRDAALHLCFEGFEAAEASSGAFLDYVGSNRVSQALGYERNGTTWATRRGHPEQMQRWRVTRETWLPARRSDVTMSGVDACGQALSQRP